MGPIARLLLTCPIMPEALLTERKSLFKRMFHEYFTGRWAHVQTAGD